MLISRNWIKKYIKFPDALTSAEIAEKLKLSTVEVEEVKNLAENLENIVVGKILNIANHPDADKLKICQVNVKNEILDIVCGGSNIAVGMLVAVAKNGARVKWHGEGDLITLQSTKIRGVESNGMICASEEIGLGEMFPQKGEKEILDLSKILKDKQIGEGVDKALGLDDAVFDIDNKSMSNRPDLWGHYGMAREIGALFKKDLKDYETKKIKAGKELDVKVVVQDKKLCPRYMAVAISGIEVKESPEWLKKSLVAVGLRPINNIVDITNYILMDLGQPMHAFDARHLDTIDKTTNGKTIVVRHAEDGEKFTTLDGQEYLLDNSMLVIADEEKPVALAGIMGGLNSEIGSDTATVIFESANFDAYTIRHTSNKLGLRTDASARFEKSLDPLNVKLALEKAVALTLELCPKAKVVSNVSDLSNFTISSGPIELNLDFLNRKIGQKIEVKEIIRILTSLGFGVKDKGDHLVVNMPSWRTTRDVSIAEDLVEEIVRIYGYDNILSQLPVFPIVPPVINELKEIEKETLDLCVKEFGFNEVYNYSFVSKKQIENLGGDITKYIELDNPLSKEKPYLRRNLILNLLENLEKNIGFEDDIKIVEIGKVFLKENPGLRTKQQGDELLPEQHTWLTGLTATKKVSEPFWEVKKIVERLANIYSVEIELLAPTKIKPWQHPGRTAELVLNKEVIGTVFELHPVTAKNFGIDIRVGWLEINLDKFLENLKKHKPIKKYLPISEYPEIIRDVCAVVNNRIKYFEVVLGIKKINPLIKNIELFDVYLKKDGSKSLAFHIVYGSNQKTLTSAEVENIHQQVLTTLTTEYKLEIR